jgi:hypothetical protein
MRTKFGGVGGSLEVTRFTKADCDAIQSDNQIDTCTRAAIGCRSIVPHAGEWEVGLIAAEGTQPLRLNTVYE